MLRSELIREAGKASQGNTSFYGQCVYREPVSCLLNLLVLSLSVSRAFHWPLVSLEASMAAASGRLHCTETEKTLIIQGTRARAIAMPGQWQHRLICSHFCVLLRPKEQKEDGQKAMPMHACVMRSTFFCAGSVSVLSSALVASKRHTPSSFPK